MDYLPDTFEVLGVPTNDLAITDTDIHVGREIAFGIAGWASGLLTIENGLDQTATVTIQGRNGAMDTWQAIETGTAVTAGSTGVIDVLNPWAQLRLSVACSVAPSEGSISCYLVRNRAGGSAGGSSVLPTSVSIASVASIVGQAVMASSIPVTMASDQSRVPVKQRGDTISVTPTVTAGAYSANDCVGGVMEFAGAARTAGEGGFITDVSIVDDAGQDVALELWLFDQTFSSPGDNAAWAATEADLHNLVGVWATDDGQWRAAGTPSVCHLKEVARFQAVGTSLFGQLVTRGTPTFVATDDVTVKIKVAQDD